MERARRSDDFTPTEREALQPGKWELLESPQEIYRELLDSGEERVILVRKFEPEAEAAYWWVAVTFYLQEEPSFLFHAWVTRDESGLVAPFRAQGKGGPETMASDHLAQNWTENESLLAELVQPRTKGDIPFTDFSKYEPCIEQTLGKPDEVWTEAFESGAGTTRTYSFMKAFVNSDTQESFGYIVITRETLTEDELEIIEAMPTRDPDYLATFRRGRQDYSIEKDGALEEGAEESSEVEMEASEDISQEHSHAATTEKNSKKRLLH